MPRARRSASTSASSSRGVVPEPRAAQRRPERRVVDGHDARGSCAPGSWEMTSCSWPNSLSRSNVVHDLTSCSRRSPCRSSGPGARRPPCAAAAGRGGTCRRPGRSCSTSRIARQTSSPMKSASASGPIGCAMPSFMTVSMASGVATPSMTQKIASLIIGIRTRLATKPGIVVHLDRRLAQRARPAPSPMPWSRRWWRGRG